jgi:hypothetical protein
MATYRKLHTTFWTDPFVEDLSQEQKLFYLYLITNTKTKQSGIYEITKKYIAYETGFGIKEVTELLQFFVEKGKVLYSETTNEIAITNWTKHNQSASPKVLECILKDLKDVKDITLIKELYNEEYVNQISNVDKPYKPFIEYLLSIHTLPIEYPYTTDTTTNLDLYSMDTNPQQEQAQAEAKEELKKEVQVEAETLTQPISVKGSNSFFEIQNKTILTADEFDTKFKI